MTVIVYKDGVIASDSRVTAGQVVDTDKQQKLFTLDDGSVVGLSGRQSHSVKMLRAIQRGLPVDIVDWPTSTKCDAILVRADGVYVQHDGVWEKYERDEAVAIGSGFREAMAVIDHGGSADQAVRVAIKRNVYCGGDVQVRRL